MEVITEIKSDSVQSVGTSGYSGLRYSASPRRSKSVINLRLGEIVHGTILDVPSQKEAVVRLPIGTFHAFLKGRLRKNDSLLFMVSELEPALVLKVYGVSVKSDNNVLTNSEIIRILDLPETQFYTELINFLKKLKTTVLRDEILQMNNTYSSLSETELGEKSFQDIFRVLYFMQEAGIPLKSKLFSKIYPLFSGPKFLFVLLKQLENKLKNYQSNTTAELQGFFSNLHSPSSDIKNLISLFTLKQGSGEQSQSFYEMLKNIISLTDTNNQHLKEIQSNASAILDILEAQTLWNLYVHPKNLPLYLFIPVIINNDFEIIQLAVNKKAEKGNPKKRILNFSFSTETKEIGNILSQGSSLDRQINLNIFSKSVPASELIAKHIDELKAQLQKNNYIVRSLTVSTMSDEYISAIQEQSQAQMQSFTIVV